MEKLLHSKEVQNCFITIFSHIYNKCNNYEDTISKLTFYLANPDNHDYDFILEKYDNVDKTILLRMICSNFVEINYYRKINKIPLDEERLFFLNKLMNNNHLLDLVCCTTKQLSIIINDVLLYFGHVSPIYSYNIVKSMAISGVDKQLFNIYPYAEEEHSQTLSYTFDRKEYLLFTLYEIIVTETERIIFASNSFPIPDVDYLSIVKMLLERFGNSELYLYDRILNTFDKRIDGASGDKAYVIQIAYNLLKQMKLENMVLDNSELSYMDECIKIKDVLSANTYYDNNKKNIIKILLDNSFIIENEHLLKDLPEQAEITKQLKQ